MDRTDTRAGEHGETGFRNHRHVNQHPVALLDTQVLQDSGHALDFTLQLRKAVSFFGIGFRGDDDQRRIVERLDQVAALVDERRNAIEAAERETRALLLKAFQRAIDGAPLRPMAEVAPLIQSVFEKLTALASDETPTSVSTSVTPSSS